MPFIRQVSNILYRGASMGFGRLLIAFSWNKARNWERGDVLLVKNSSSSVRPVTGSERLTKIGPPALQEYPEGQVYLSRQWRSGISPEDGDGGE